MADYGVKVANDNSDIYSEIPGDYELWSKYPTLKVKGSGSGTESLVVSGGTGSFSVEIDDDPTTFDPIIFVTTDVYDPVDGSTFSDVQAPYRRQSSTGLINCLYSIVRDTGKLYYRGSVEGGSDGTYSLDYEYIILYDKFNG